MAFCHQLVEITDSVTSVRREGEFLALRTGEWHTDYTAEDVSRWVALIEHASSDLWARADLEEFFEIDFGTFAAARVARFVHEHITGIETLAATL